MRSDFSSNNFAHVTLRLTKKNKQPTNKHTSPDPEKNKNLQSDVYRGKGTAGSLLRGEDRRMIAKEGPPFSTVLVTLHEDNRRPNDSRQGRKYLG